MTKAKNCHRILILLVAVILLAMQVQIASAKTNINRDGEYAIELNMTGGSGKASVQTPTLLTIKDGKYYAKIVWSSSNYDYMIVDGKKYLNEADDESNSTFTIPITKVDEEMTVIADTLAMGTPHEIEYKFTFFSDSVQDKSTLPQEGAKRVCMMAGAIIIVGAVCSHFTKRRRNRDFNG